MKPGTTTTALAMALEFDEAFAAHMAIADAEVKALLENDGRKFDCKCEVCAPFADSDAPLGGMFDE